MDPVFKALADPTRRLLLDRSAGASGQTLGELCEQLAMARQSATQHLDILVRANLVTVVRRGRERLHYLNPVPIHEIEERWISGFDKPRLRAISAIKNQAEEYAMTTEPAPSLRLRHLHPRERRAGLAGADRRRPHGALLGTRQRLGLAAGLEPGNTGASTDQAAVDVVGRVIEAEPPNRLVITFEDAPDAADAGSPRSSPSSSSRTRTSSASP